MKFLKLAEELAWHPSDVAGRRDCVEVARRLLTDPSAISFLQTLYDSEKEDPPSTAERLRERRYLSEIESAVGDEFWDEAVALALQGSWLKATVLICTVEPKRALMALRKETGGEGSDFRRTEAIRLLGSIGDLDDGLVFWNLLDDSNAEVRRAAADALERLAMRIQSALPRSELRKQSRSRDKYVRAVMNGILKGTFHRPRVRQVRIRKR